MPTIVGNYELVKKIGEGGYGKIFLGRPVIGFVPGDEVVLKQVKLPTNKQEREMCLRCVVGVVSSISLVNSLHVWPPSSPVARHNDNGAELKNLNHATLFPSLFTRHTPIRL